MTQTLPKLSHPLVDDAQYNLLRSVGISLRLNVVILLMPVSSVI